MDIHHNNTKQIIKVLVFRKMVVIKLHVRQMETFIYQLTSVRIGL